MNLRFCLSEQIRESHPFYSDTPAIHLWCKKSMSGSQTTGSPFTLFQKLLIKLRIKKVKIIGVQRFFRLLQRLAKPLEMHHFPGP